MYVSFSNKIHILIVIISIYNDMNSIPSRYSISLFIKRIKYCIYSFIDYISSYSIAHKPCSKTEGIVQALSLRTPGRKWRNAESTKLKNGTFSCPDAPCSNICVGNSCIINICNHRSNLWCLIIYMYIIFLFI